MILILTEAGPKYGYGHLCRCIAVCQGFQQRTDQRFVALVRGTRKIPSVFNIPHLSFIYRDWIKSASWTLSQALAADYVLLDSYQASQSFYDKLQGPLRKNLLVFDDAGRLVYTNSIILNPVGSPPRNKRGALFLTGKKFMILRQPFWKCRRIQIRSQIKNVFISLGGTAKPKQLVPLLKWFLNRTSYNVKLLIPRRLMLRVSSPRLKIFYQRNGEQIKSLLLNCDLALNAGGQGLYEIIRTGLPAIATILASNQTSNVRALTHARAVENVGSFEHPLFFFRLDKKLKRIFPPKTRTQMSLAAYRFSDGQGARRVVQALLKENKLFLRKVTLRDKDLIFQWRNHALARRNSFNESKISFRSHSKWFNKTRKNPEWFMGCYHGQPLGHIRFDRIDNREALVHINLNPKFIGKRWGKRLLAKAIREEFSRHPPLKTITAKVKMQNRSSRKVFEAVGFTKSGQEGPSVRIYKIEKGYYV